MTKRNQSILWDLPQEFLFKGQSVRFGVIGDGPPLVFVHGTPFSSVVWRSIVPHFARDRRVYFFDLLGYGQSEMREGQDVSLGIQNDLFAGLLQHWKIERPDVVAHDFGGATALRTHLLNRVDFASLTLIDPVAIAPWGSPFVQHVRTHEGAFSGAPPYIHDAILIAYLSGAAFQPLSSETLDLYSMPWRERIGQAAFYRQIAQMDQRFTDDIADLNSGRSLSCADPLGRTGSMDTHRAWTRTCVPHSERPVSSGSDGGAPCTGRFSRNDRCRAKEFLALKFGTPLALYATMEPSRSMTVSSDTSIFVFY